MNTKYISIVIVFAAILLWSSGCKKPFGIEGNNQVITETRQMVSFDRIANDGSFNVYIVQDTIYQVIVEAESNLIPYIRTRVNGNTLEIDTKENLNSNSSMNIYVRTAEVNGIYLNGSGIINMDSLSSNNLIVDISGSGNINLNTTANSVNAKISGSGAIFLGAKTTNIETRISGSGNIDLTGETNTGKHTISGSGNINAYNFMHKECEAKISGSGNMYLNVTDMLDVYISGSGSVFYIGDPQLSVSIPGSGGVYKQ